MRISPNFWSNKLYFRGIHSRLVLNGDGGRVGEVGQVFTVPLPTDDELLSGHGRFSELTKCDQLQFDVPKYGLRAVCGPAKFDIINKVDAP